MSAAKSPKRARSPKSPKLPEVDEFERTLSEYGAPKGIKLRPTTGERIANVAIALLTVAAPVYLYVAVFGMGVKNFALIYAGVTLLSGVILSFAYQNTAHQTWHYLLFSREARVLKALTKVKTGKDTIKKNAESKLAVEARAFSFLKTNTLFYFLVAVLAAVFFANTAGPINYSCTLLFASSIILFLSGGSTR